VSFIKEPTSGFEQNISNTLTTLIEAVRVEILKDTRTWLATLQNMNSQVGGDVFSRVIKQPAVWKNNLNQNPLHQDHKFNFPVELAFEESGGNFLTNDAINLDLLQLCECVLILRS
jgi:hypothetical protein